MSTLVARGIPVLLVVIGILEGIAALTPLGRAPLRLHDWWLLPVACAEVRCVTYPRWAGTLRASGFPNEKAPDVLSRLLAGKASALVARRSGLSVSEEEVDAALRALDETASEPRIEAFLKTRPVDLRSKAFRKAMRDLLLREKLAAAGSADVWKHPGAPRVMILHARYRWNASTHRVEAR